MKRSHVPNTPAEGRRAHGTGTVCTPRGAHPASRLRDPLASLLWFSTSHFPSPVLRIEPKTSAMPGKWYPCAAEPALCHPFVKHPSNAFQLPFTVPMRRCSPWLWALSMGKERCVSILTVCDKSPVVREKTGEFFLC